MMRTQKGFTLIELLVVISIIGTLSSIVMGSLNGARAKARDSKAISEFRQINIALEFYYQKYGAYPNVSPVVTNPWTDNFNSMATQLVAEGFLAAVPVAPINHTYHYYNYLSGGTAGALLKTNIESVPSNTTGLSGSCRPFTNNWCSSTLASTDYCLCNPH
jgi:type II secretion system protein G